MAAGMVVLIWIVAGIYDKVEAIKSAVKNEIIRRHPNNF
jgi:hypothetical protein